VLAFSLQRVHEWLCKRGVRPALSAALLAISSALVTVGGLLLLLYFVIVRGVVALRSLAEGFGPEGVFRRLLARLDAATHALPFGSIDVTGRARAAMAEGASKLTSAFAMVADATFSALLMLFFTTMAAFFVLRNWGQLIRGAERTLPLHPAHTRVLLDEFQTVGKQVFVGTVLTGAAQGILAGIGYALGGAPEAMLLGVLTAACSLVPAVGTMLAWLPVGIGLIASGRPGAGTFIILWGLLIVSVVSDYVIRPKLVDKGGQVPALLTFIALFGGVQTFGLMGLIVGPVVAAVSVALLRTYHRENSEANLDS